LSPVLRTSTDVSTAQLEEQRIETRELIDDFLKKVGKEGCYGNCHCQRWHEESAGLNLQIGSDPKLLLWPKYSKTQLGLRQSLDAIRWLGDCLDLKQRKIHYTPKDSRHRARFTKFAIATSHQLHGLCLTCTKEGRSQMGNCEHLVAMRDRIAKLDVVEYELEQYDR
jgi:hypothetical protein